MPTTHADVLILGGGPAGLALGWALEKVGLSYHLVEAARTWGGNARTIVDGDFRFDTGPHRFHDRDAEATARVAQLLGNQLHEVTSPSRIYWNHRFIDFPLRPVKALTCGSLRHGIKSVVDFARGKMRQAHQANDFATWACNSFGHTLAQTFLIPFSEKLWGLPSHELSPAIAGRRLPGFSLWTILKDLLFYNPHPEHLEAGRFLYPRLGYGQIVDEMASRLAPSRIHLQCRVIEAKMTGHADACVTCRMPEGLVQYRGSVVVNTLPVTTFCRILNPVPPEHVLKTLSRLQFRNVVLVVLYLNTKSISKAACTYFPGRSIAFSRIHEPRNRSHAMAPPGKTSLVAEYPCFEDEPVWRADKQTLVDDLTSTLVEMGVISRDHLIGASVVRLRQAYPVYVKDFETRLMVVHRYLSAYKHLRMLGRGGEFFYGHVHDFIGKAFNLADKLAIDKLQSHGGKP